MFETFHWVRVSFHHLDKVGIVHFSNLFKYVEEAEESFFRALDPGSLDQVWGAGPGGLGWIRLKADLEFLHPARLDDRLLIHLWLAEKKSRSLEFGVRISNREKIVAQGRIKTMCVRMEPDGHKTCRIPKALDRILTIAPWAQGWPGE